MVVAAADPQQETAGLPPAAVRAGAALQVLRGVLVAGGLAARWLTVLPEDTGLPAGFVPLAAIEVGLRRPEDVLPEPGSHQPGSDEPGSDERLARPVGRPGAHDLAHDRELPDVVGVVRGDLKDLAQDGVLGV